MIPSYSDHAANERTFLAWVRTGIAVMAFGFVIERFDLFVLAMAADSSDAGRRLQLESLLGPLGRYDGLALIFVGIALLVVGALRFVRTERLLDEQQIHSHSAHSVRAELILSAVLALLVAAVGISLVIG